MSKTVNFKTMARFAVSDSGYENGIEVDHRGTIYRRNVDGSLSRVDAKRPSKRARRRAA